jgi:acyl-CoA synthetase (AMP-forming)/AMP-acid ligase II
MVRKFATRDPGDARVGVGGPIVAVTTIESRRDVGGWNIRWNPDMAKRAVDDGDWPNLTVAQFAQRRAREHAERVQLVDGGRSISCGELYDSALHLAGFFRALGLNRGDVVSFQLPNWWEASVIDLAAAMTGVVTNPIVPINRDAEVTYMLNESRTRLLFIPGVFRKFDYAEMLRRISPALTRSPTVVVVRAAGGDYLEFDAVLRGATRLQGPDDVDPNAVKLLMYTSGTTGRPKGVLHSHNTFHADSRKMQPAMGLSAADVIFCPSPVTHVSGYLWALNMPWCGDMPTVMLDIWDPEQAFDLMRTHRCSFSVGATPFLQDLVGVARRRSETLPDLKSYMCGGASVPPSLIYEAAEVFPNCIPWRTFGATEAPTLTGPPVSRQDLRLGAETDGKLNRSEIKIIDLKTGAAALADEEGEILVREPSMALGYARDEDNQGAYDEEGFFRMGDIGRLVEVDHIVCTGRKKDLIIRAGENISAKEVEDTLHRSGRVIEVAIVAMPSQKTGEAICAFIVPRDGDALDLADVARIIGDAGLARQKIPAHVELVTELPKTASGKIRKDLLREQAKSFRVD